MGGMVFRCIQNSVASQGEIHFRENKFLLPENLQMQQGVFQHNWPTRDIRRSVPRRAAAFALLTLVHRAAFWRLKRRSADFADTEAVFEQILGADYLDPSPKHLVRRFRRASVCVVPDLCDVSDLASLKFHRVNIIG